MKKTLVLVVALVAVLAALLLWPENKPAPQFTLPNLQGVAVSNADLQGKVTLMNFWYPSCPGCVSEMPKLVKTAEKYQNTAFQILAVSQPFDPIESVRNYAETRSLPFAVMYDADGAVGKAFGTQVYPTSFLIDKQGRILKTFVGEPDFDKLYAEIDSELAK